MPSRDDKRRQQIAMTPQLRIAELVAEHGSYRSAAKKIGIHYGYLYRVGTGSKEASANLLSLLGLERHVTYTTIGA